MRPFRLRLAFARFAQEDDVPQRLVDGGFEVAEIAPLFMAVRILVISP